MPTLHYHTVSKSHVQEDDLLEIHPVYYSIHYSVELSTSAVVNTMMLAVKHANDNFFIIDFRLLTLRLLIIERSRII